MGSEKSR